jgi:phospholipid/cholesterol/gamma-HCH transport system substrate-binding protein
MKPVTKDLLTGLAGLGGLAGLATLLLYYGELTGVVSPRYQVNVALDQAGGLRSGSLVTLNGVPVGEVETIRLEEPPSLPSHPVLVDARIDRAVGIPENVTVDVEVSLLGGGARLALAVPLPYEAGVAMLPQTPPPTIVGRARGLEGLVGEALESRLATFEATLEEIRLLARTYTEVGANLNDLLVAVDPEDPAADSNLRTTVSRLNATLGEARAAIALASGWLGDEQLQADVKSAVWRANVLVEHATEAVDAIESLAESLGTEAGRAVDTFDARAGEIVAAITPVADGASVLLGRLDELAKVAAEGDGTVGQLLQNPDLYNSLVDSAKRLEATLRKVELLIEKIRQEGLGVF